MDTDLSKNRKPWVEWTISVMALSMIAYHIWSIWYPIFNSILHQNIHLGFSLIILLLTLMNKSTTRLKYLVLPVLVFSLVVTVYVHFNYERLDMWAGYPEKPDIVIGIILAGLVVFITQRIWGNVFPVLLAISILYALFGHHIKGALGHSIIEPKLVLSNLGIGLKGTYGMMLNASANLIFLFIIFGSIFELVGIDKFFLEVGSFLGKHLRGGSAQTAVFSSSFVGMCTGAAAANVALTGSYTIPLMKDTGFKPEHAGAIEAVASTGGQLTPPVMGVAIFLMASFLGVNYASLMARALLPALVFYACVILGVILIASREKVPMLKKSVDRQIMISGAPLFIIPMSLITLLLIFRYTPAYAATLALASLLVLASIRTATRPSVTGLIKGFSKGAVMGAGIAVACGCIGMFMSMLTTTGAGPKLAGVIQILSDGHVPIALVLTMLLSILLGCAMPTPVAYVITALVVSPALVDMGLNMMTAHFFVFYFAILSAVTPPVAGASMVGSQIAKSNYLVTGWESLKLTAPFFIVPFFIVRNPIVLTMSQPIPEAIAAILALVIACGAFMVFCQGFCLSPVRSLERYLYLVTAILAIIFGQFGGNLLLLVSLALATGLIIVQLRKRRTMGLMEKG